MGKTKHEKTMEKLGLQEQDLFKIGYDRIAFLYKTLSNKYEKDDILDLRSMLLRFIGQIIGISQSIYSLFMTTRDMASMIILARSVNDINAMVYFFFRHITDPNERSLRILLFFLDGVRRRLSLSNEPMNDRNEDIISEEEYNAVLEQKMFTRLSDIKAQEDLERMIKESPLYPRMHSKIFQNALWRFISLDSNKKYSWKDLYNCAMKDSKMANYTQVYFSDYVHGTAIAHIQSKSINEIDPVFALNVCLEILHKLPEIIMEWFPDDYYVLEEEYEEQLVKKMKRNIPTITFDNCNHRQIDSD